MQRFICLLAFLALALPGCRAGTSQAEQPGSSSSEEPPVEIGTGPDEESRLLATVMKELLEANGLPATVETFDDRQAVRQALELGAVDVAPGYTGEAWLEVLGRAEPPGDPEASFRRIREADRERGLFWMRPEFSDEVRLDRPPANATFAFFVLGPPHRAAPPLRNLTEFASRVVADTDARVCVDRGFGDRADGLAAVWRAYSVDPERDYYAASPDDAIGGVSLGDCLAGLATATDGDAWRIGLRPLQDDRRVFPAFVVAPVVREEALRDRPDLLSALNPLPAYLTTRMLGEWNARVAGGQPVEAVAATAAESLLAVAAPPTPESTPTS